MRGLARDPRFGFWELDTDAATGHHPPDPYGEHVHHDWPLEIDLLALHAKISLARGSNLVLDPGLLLSATNVNRFLRKLGRNRKERRVLLIRLAVEQERAVRRKSNVRPDVVRASHLGWQPMPIHGEIEIDTTDMSAAQVLRAAKRVVQARLGARLR